MKVVRHWHRFPMEIVPAPLLEVFKVRLDGDLYSLVWRKVPLSMVGDWDGMISNIPSTPTILLFCDIFV